MIYQKLSKPAYRWVLGLVVILFVNACQSDDEPEPPSNNFLVEYEEVASFTSEQLQIIGALTGYSAYQDLIEYGVKLYKITYNTELSGESVVASGIISIPQGTKQFPLLLAGHGTITSQREAPSNLNVNQQNATGFELFGAFGFTTIIPDYLGFGSSAELVHPYYDYEASARSSIDMIKATEEFLADSIPYNPELFLTGYSQGGYVTVATLKYLEEAPQALPGIDLKAAAAGAGGYDIQRVMETVFDEGTYPAPVILSYLVYSYHQTNQWERPLTDFFLEPYASQIPGLFDGNSSTGEINIQLPQDLSLLLNPDFLARMRDGSETEFLNALKDNSVHDWAPQTTLRLFHEADDEVLPIQNSERTYERMLELGAEKVYFFPYDEASNHLEGAQPMYQQVVPWFISLREYN